MLRTGRFIRVREMLPQFTTSALQDEFQFHVLILFIGGKSLLPVRRFPVLNRPFSGGIVAKPPKSRPFSALVR